VLGLVLVAFSAATRSFLKRLTEDRVDQSLTEAVAEFRQVSLPRRGAG
jgi:hypothetical protein